MGDCGDVGFGQFPKQDIHNIGLLDIRLFNMDRHSGNILFRKTEGCQGGKQKKANEQYELIPIDHGYCLPESKCLIKRYLHLLIDAFSKTNLECFW